MKKAVSKKKRVIKRKPLHHHPAVFVSIILALVGLFFVTKTILAQQVIIIPNPPDTDYASKKNLQLRTFSYITLPPAQPITPMPTSPEAMCQDDTPKTPACQCHDP